MRERSDGAAHGSGEGKAIMGEFSGLLWASDMAVEPEWIDYNGHVNVAYYVTLFDRAVDEVFARIGMGEDYLKERNLSFFAAEIHVRYLNEIKAGDVVRISIQLIAHDEKRIHYFLQMHHAVTDTLCATSENLSLHIDMRVRRVAPFPMDVFARLERIMAAHERLPLPDGVGRAVALKR